MGWLELPRSCRSGERKSDQKTTGLVKTAAEALPFWTPSPSPSSRRPPRAAWPRVARLWTDEDGRIGIEPTQDGRITWCAVRRDVFVPVEVAPPTPEQDALLDLVSYGVSGPPDKR